MIQVQFVLDFKAGNNVIQCNILTREDANDLERAMAAHIQELHRAIIEDIAAQLPDGDVTTEAIE
jgi:hypothetical protein